MAYGDRTLSYDQLRAAAERLADALAVDAGERVAVVSPNLPALVVGLLAVWRAGAVAVPLSARLRRFELGRAFSDAQPAAVVSVATHGAFALAEEIETLAEHTPSLRGLVVVDEFGEVTDRSMRTGERTEPSAPELAAILYTSGTTGEPKGAQVSHAMAEAMAANLASVLGADAGAPYGLVVPGTHAFGLGCLLAGMTAGAMAVLVDTTTSLDPLLRSLRRHNARVLHGSPALFSGLLRSGAGRAIRGGFTAGSWCAPELLEALEEQGTRILNLYGMTELGSISCCRQDDPAVIRYGTVGRALPGYDVRVAEQPDGADVGEIQVRTAYLPSGYHGRPWSSDEITDDGWLRTGDLGELNANGNLVIAGRAKEVVHVGGFNVFPAEVESFLHTNPGIAGAVVLGMPHPVLGEALQAFVTAAPGANLQPRDVVSFARSGIAGYKVPYRVHVIDELPWLASGKPDRRALARSLEQTELARR